MSAQGVFKITEEFERLLCEYTGAPYAIAVDNCSNALFLALTYKGARGCEVSIPRQTYPSVPCEIIHAGGTVGWQGSPLHPAFKAWLRGPYELAPLNVWDCALRFTGGMYVAGQTQCLSFTGPHKHLKLGKGGAILTDDPVAAAWYKRARFSGRRECSYHDDDFDMLGWNFYLMPEVAARGVLLMAGMWHDGVPVHNEDLCLPFPDLSRFPVYNTAPRSVGSITIDIEVRMAQFERDFDQALQTAGEHIACQSGAVIREDEPTRCTVPAQAEPWEGYEEYHGARH